MRRLCDNLAYVWFSGDFDYFQFPTVDFHVFVEATYLNISFHDDKRMLT